MYAEYDAKLTYVQAHKTSSTCNFNNNRDPALLQLKFERGIEKIYKFKMNDKTARCTLVAKKLIIYVKEAARP